MLFTAHVLVGAVIGKYIGSIWLVIILAFISHYILDIIPHRSMKTPFICREHGINAIPTREFFLKCIEPFLGLILIFYIISLHKSLILPMIVGAFFAWFPDALCYFSWKYYLTKFDKFLPRPGGKLYNVSSTFFVGALTQVIVLILALVLLFYKIS